MQVVRFGPDERVGVLEGAWVRPLPQTWTVVDALTAPAAEVTDSLGEAIAKDSVELLAPLTTPASLRDCVGFLDHIRNARQARGISEPLPEEWSIRPAFYFANPSSLLSATTSVAIPPQSEAFDFELEIGVVIGRGGRDLSVDEAGEHIAGYVLYCDWSARDIQSQERAMQIGQGKGKDSAISLGPWVLKSDAAEPLRQRDGLNMVVSIHVDHDQVLETAFLGMDWSFEELVAYASIGADIRPGDVIASGTVPRGCLLEHSADHDFRGWLQPGQTVRLDAGPLGEIVTTINEPRPVASWRHLPASSDPRPQR